MPPDSAAFYYLQLLAFLAFTLLVSNTAAGLASGLAGSLAFAAAAVLSAFAQITGFDGLNMFHGVTSIKVFRMYFLMLPHDWHKVNIGGRKSGKFLNTFVSQRQYGHNPLLLFPPAHLCQPGTGSSNIPRCREYLTSLSFGNWFLPLWIIAS